MFNRVIVKPNLFCFRCHFILKPLELTFTFVCTTRIKYIHNFIMHKILMYIIFKIKKPEKMILQVFFVNLIKIPAFAGMTRCCNFPFRKLEKLYFVTFKTSAIILSNSAFGNAPFDICGAPSAGQNNIEGILLIPNAADNSCSASVSIL